MRLVDYDLHPGFHGISRPIGRYEDDIEQFGREISDDIVTAEEELTLNKTTLARVAHRISSKLAGFMGMLADSMDERDPRTRAFLDGLWKGLNRILLDDLEYFERRGSYTPVIQNSAELARYWNFEKDGYLVGTLSPEFMRNLNSQLEPFKVSLLQNATNGDTSRERLSTNTIPQPIVKMLADEFDRQGIRQAIMASRREIVALTGFSLELSVPNAQWWSDGDYTDVGVPVQECSYFHTDESRDVYKAILYLDDVEREAQGATSIIPTSFGFERDRLQWMIGRAFSDVDRSAFSDLGRSGRHLSSPNFRKLFMSIPPSLRQNSHWGFDGLDSFSQVNKLTESREVILGPSGTFLAFDGSRLMHRGGLVKEGHRWALQIVFYVNKSHHHPFDWGLKDDFRQQSSLAVERYQRSVK